MPNNVPPISDDPDVRLRIGTTLYDLHAVRVTDAAELARVQNAYERKYDVGDKDNRPQERFVFRLGGELATTESTCNSRVDVPRRTHGRQHREQDRGVSRSLGHVVDGGVGVQPTKLFRYVDVTGPQPMTIAMPGMEPGDYQIRAFYEGVAAYTTATSPTVSSS